MVTLASQVLLLRTEAGREDPKFKTFNLQYAPSKQEKKTILRHKDSHGVMNTRRGSHKQMLGSVHWTEWRKN